MTGDRSSLLAHSARGFSLNAQACSSPAKGSRYGAIRWGVVLLRANHSAFISGQFAKTDGCVSDPGKQMDWRLQWNAEARLHARARYILQNAILRREGHTVRSFVRFTQRV